jgi:hypothetical protein
MKRFSLKKTFKKLRSESQHRQKAGAELARRKQEEWTASSKRSTIILQLNDILPREDAGTLDVERATKLMIEYAQTLSTDWVKARVKFVNDRIAKMAAEGKPALNADLKEILLNLLQFAREGHRAKVAEIFNEATQGDSGLMESFRHCLVNWLGDKVVDTWHPVPEELRPPVEKLLEEPKEEAFLDVSPTMSAEEEWMPARKAVDWAEQKGFSITLKWLTQDSPKHGVRVRKPQQPGRHKKEVEINSLAQYLFKDGKLLERAPLEEEDEQENVSRRIREAIEKKRRERSLD